MYKAVPIVAKMLEALKVFESKGLNEIIEEAIIAAYKKSKEIGNS